MIDLKCIEKQLICVSYFVYTEWIQVLILVIYLVLNPNIFFKFLISLKIKIKIKIKISSFVAPQANFFGSIPRLRNDAFACTITTTITTKF